MKNELIKNIFYPKLYFYIIFNLKHCFKFRYAKFPLPSIVPYNTREFRDFADSSSSGMSNWDRRVTASPLCIIIRVNFIKSGMSLRCSITMTPKVPLAHFLYARENVGLFLIRLTANPKFIFDIIICVVKYEVFSYRFKSQYTLSYKNLMDIGIYCRRHDLPILLA